jgi:hypothetical protein
MANHLFPRFLEDRSEYRRAAAFWTQLWERIDLQGPSLRGWQHPWFAVDLDGPPDLLDGNPIFSAVSPERRQGVRIIQYPPTSGELELEWWLDTFGGPADDPDAIHELVISCALSDKAAAKATELIRAWLDGGLSPEPVDEVEHGAA